MLVRKLASPLYLATMLCVVPTLRELVDNVAIPFARFIGDPDTPSITKVTVPDGGVPKNVSVVFVCCPISELTVAVRFTVSRRRRGLEILKLVKQKLEPY